MLARALAPAIEQEIASSLQRLAAIGLLVA